MGTETKFNADEWKSGTDALALCMICGAEYNTKMPECPDCHVSLSIVRRCPNCHRIVSAQHTKCVYCRASFTHEIPKLAGAEQEVAPEGTRAASKGVRRFRAASVSIITFVIVFCLGMFFLHEMHKPAFAPRIIANSQVMHSAQLRGSPSLSSSVAGTVVPGTKLDIAGYQENGEGRWIAVDWNNAVAYLLSNELSAPRAVDANDGAKALRFYLEGMESTESVDDAVKAVDAYAKAFPGSEQTEDLRWVLAERIRLLAQHGGSQGLALRQKANQQYGRLTEPNGRFADKARDAMNRPLSGPETETRPRGSKGPRAGKIGVPKPDGLEIIGGSGTVTSTSSSVSHQALVLTHPEILVRVKLSNPEAAGSVITGFVARQLNANGAVAVPAGATCQLTVTSADPTGAQTRLQLTSIEIDHRAYAVQSTTVEIRSHSGTTPTGTLAVSFRLSAPLVIEQ